MTRGLRMLRMLTCCATFKLKIISIFGSRTKGEKHPAAASH